MAAPPLTAFSGGQWALSSRFPSYPSQAGALRASVGSTEAATDVVARWYLRCDRSKHPGKSLRGSTPSQRLSPSTREEKKSAEKKTITTAESLDLQVAIRWGLLPGGLPTRNEEAYRSRAVLRRGEEAREDLADLGRQDQRRAVQGAGRSLCQKHILPWTSHMSYALAPSA